MWGLWFAVSAFAEDPSDWDRFRDAIVAHDVAAVKAQLAQGMDPNFIEGAVHIDGEKIGLNTAINETLRGNFFDLLSRATPANYQDAPMQAAIRAYHPGVPASLEVLKVLLDAGADPNRGTAQYGAPLALLLNEADFDNVDPTPALALLLDHGATPTLVDRGQVLPGLIDNSRRDLVPKHADARDFRERKTLALLLERGADPNLGKPICEAVSRSDEHLLAQLLAKGASAHVDCDFQKSPLEMAAGQWNTDALFDRLLAHDPEFQGIDASTLCIAVKNAVDHPDTVDRVRRLMDAGASPDVSCGGSVPATLAVKAGRWELFETLIKGGHPARWDGGPVCEAVNRPEALDKVLYLFLDHGGDVNARCGRTPLVGALLPKHPEIAAALLDRGARVENGEWNLVAQSGHDAVFLEWLGQHTSANHLTAAAIPAFGRDVALGVPSGPIEAWVPEPIRKGVEAIGRERTTTLIRSLGVRQWAAEMAHFSGTVSAGTPPTGPLCGIERPRDLKRLLGPAVRSADKTLWRYDGIEAVLFEKKYFDHWTLTAKGAELLQRAGCTDSRLSAFGATRVETELALGPPSRSGPEEAIWNEAGILVRYTQGRVTEMVNEPFTIHHRTLAAQPTPVTLHLSGGSWFDVWIDGREIGLRNEPVDVPVSEGTHLIAFGPFMKDPVHTLVVDSAGGSFVGIDFRDEGAKCVDHLWCY